MAATKKVSQAISLAEQKRLRAAMKAARLEILRSELVVAKVAGGVLAASALIAEIERAVAALTLIKSQFSEE